MDTLVNGTAAVLRALQHRDTNTSEHCGRTKQLAMEIGRACQLSSADLASLNLAAELHDVGKIGIPDRILLKPGRLDDEELRVMRTHPRLGHDILMSVADERMPSVANAVLRHHEAMDGSGYPDGLAGEAIPILSRIVSIADAYDALATVRPYHKPRSHADVMQLLAGEKADKFDPYVLTVFKKIIASSSARYAGTA